MANKRFEETVLTRRDKAPVRKEGFPEHLSPTRRTRDPVIYVPGFFRFYILSAAIRRRLKNLDFEVYTIRLPNFVAGDIRKGARILLSRMEEVRVLLGIRRISLIGQGLGGLVARCMAEQMGGMDFVSRLIMLGTPNSGSHAFYPFIAFKGARQMLPSSSFMADLSRDYRALLESGFRPPYTSIYTPFDIAVIPPYNCRLEGVENLRVGWFCTHMGLVRSRNLIGILARLLDGDAPEEDGRDEDALLEELTQSLRENPSDEADLLRRGKMLLDRGYYSWAIRDLTQLIRLRPDFADVYMLRGKALRRKIGYDENPMYNRAIRDFSTVIKLKPGSAEAYYERGVCYALLNAWSDALDNWDRALILNRDLYQAYLARGLGRKKKGDIAGAVEDFSEVLRIQPDEPEALRFLSDMGRG